MQWHYRNGEKDTVCGGPCEYHVILSDGVSFHSPRTLSPPTAHSSSPPPSMGDTNPIMHTDQGIATLLPIHEHIDKLKSSGKLKQMLRRVGVSEEGGFDEGRRHS